MQINFKKNGFKRRQPLAAAVRSTAKKSPSPRGGAGVGEV